jgi:AraC-like DNA-binding protein
MPRERRTDASERLSIVIDRVRSDLARRWTVTDMAAILGVTSGQLRRLLADEGHPPPRRLLAELRLSTAAALLSDPGVRVKEVAARIGIADGSHFCRDFKRRYGLSPLAFQSVSIVNAIKRNARAHQ